MQNINLAKYILLMVAICILIGLVAAFINRLLAQFSVEIPSGLVGGLLVGGVLVLVNAYINKSINRGGLKWLLKR